MVHFYVYVSQDQCKKHALKYCHFLLVIPFGDGQMYILGKKSEPNQKSIFFLTTAQLKQSTFK